jgi:glycosyltransferase involved in cell wall biosynthesis
MNPTLALADRRDLPAPLTGLSGWPWEAADPLVPPPLPAGQAWPRISLVTPSYNQGRFIEATLRSVLLQGYPNLEYIVMDGGSTDESLAVIQRYAAHLAYWTSRPDRGQSHALNQGFARASGEVLGWLNSDDVLLPGALFRVGAAFAAQPETLLVHGRAENIDAAGNRLHYHPYAAPYDRRWLLEQCNLIPQPAAFFRREFLAQAGGLNEDLHYTMDWDLWLRLDTPARAHYLPDVLAQMRTYPEAKSVAGGRKIHGELRHMLARHGGLGLPAMVVSRLIDQHWQQACTAYARGEVQTGRDELAYVLEHAADWRTDSRRLARQISNYAWELLQPTGDESLALRFAETVAGHLPEGAPPAARVRAQALALLYEGLAFRAWTAGQAAPARRRAWQAMRLDPRCLTSRGLWSVALRSRPRRGPAA